jgi:hypothetical protein
MSENSTSRGWCVLVKPRPLSWAEVSVLGALIEAMPSGRREAEAQLAGVRVTAESSGPDLSVLLTVPVTAAPIPDDGMVSEALDDQEPPVAMLLHVRQGKLAELEAFMADGSLLQTLPDPERLKFV